MTNPTGTPLGPSAGCHASCRRTSRLRGRDWSDTRRYQMKTLCSMKRAPDLLLGQGWKLPRALTIADAVRDIVTALGQWARERSLINQKEYSGAELTSPEITHPARPGIFPVRRFPSPWASDEGTVHPSILFLAFTFCRLTLASPWACC